MAVLQEELFCVGHPDILGAHATPIELNDLADLPLALLGPGDLSRALSDRVGAMARLERHTTLELASVAATIGALEAGLACSIVPKVLVRSQLELGVLIARPIISPTPSRTLYLLSRKSDRPTRLSERMAELIFKLCAAAVMDHRWPAARLPDQDLA